MATGTRWRMVDRYVLRRRVESILGLESSQPCPGAGNVSVSEPPFRGRMTVKVPDSLPLEADALPGCNTPQRHKAKHRERRQSGRRRAWTGQWLWPSPSPRFHRGHPSSIRRGTEGEGVHIVSPRRIGAALYYYRQENRRIARWTRHRWVEEAKGRWD